MARAYHASATPEAIALNRTNFNIWNVFYRGVIDDRLGSNATATTQYYLSNALTAFLAGAPITVSRTRPAGCDIAARPVTPGVG